MVISNELTQLVRPPSCGLCYVWKSNPRLESVGIGSPLRPVEGHTEQHDILLILCTAAIIHQHELINGDDDDNNNMTVLDGIARFLALSW